MKVRIQLEEVVKYSAIIEVIQPGDMDDEKFDLIVEHAERQCRHGQGSFDDFIDELRKRGLEITKDERSHLSSPDSVELEILDVSNVKEVESKRR
jgi:hypothetical protein